MIVFLKLKRLIPGNDDSSKLSFINKSFDSTKDWMGSFVAKHNITQNKVMTNIQGFVDFTEGQLDYVAAFLDMSTNYFEHTGTQSIARSLISRAMMEV